MTQPDLARLEGLVAIASEDGFTPEIEQQFMDELPALLARVRELREALERIASEHIRLPDEPHGHIWHRDCDACNARQIAQETLNKETPDAG